MKRNKNICGIYKITNPIGEVYIGSSKDVKKRIMIHKSSSGHPKLKNSFAKYGIENHLFEIILECDYSELLLNEKKFIFTYNSIENGLNTNPIVNTVRKTQPDSGIKPLPEEEKRIRIEPFVKKKIVDKLGRKNCEGISVSAINKEYLKSLRLGNGSRI